MVADVRRDEVALLTGVVAGDRTSVRTLLDDVAPVVYGFAYARVGGDRAAADDILQETILEAVRSAATFRGESTLTTWMCTIARRRIARHYERERRQEVARRGLSVVPSSDDDEPAMEIDATFEQRDELVRALGKLSPLHRQVLVLKYLDSRSVEEIATELGRTRVQVQSLLQRARAGLKRTLERSGDDAD